MIKDNEIIKALEKVKQQYGTDCYTCEAKSICRNKTCPFHTCDYALYLINRQKAEIERLNETKDEWKLSAINKARRVDELTNEIAKLKFSSMIGATRAEAIKEFAERVCADRVTNDPVVIAVRCAVKEMTEEMK